MSLPALVQEKHQSFIAGHHADSIQANAVVNMAHGRLGDYFVEFMKQKNIPLFSPLNINRLTTEWESDKQGMNGGFMSQSIVTPEIDGAIRPYVVFGQRINKEDTSISSITSTSGKPSAFGR